jgi:hypothetical protein
MSLDIQGVLSLTPQSTYAIDNQEPVPFSVGDSSLINSTGMLLFETVNLPHGLHNLSVVYLGNSSTAPLAFTYLIQNGPHSLPSSSTTIHRKPIVGGVIGWLILISLFFNIWPSHVS